MSRILIIEAALPAITVHQLDVRGRVLTSTRRQVPLTDSESGVREIDRNGVLALLREAMQECLARDKGLPLLIAVTGPVDGLILSSDRGLPVRPPIAGDDIRAMALIDQWIDSGIAAAGYRRSGSAPSTGSTTTLLRYLLDTEPRSLERAERAWNGVCGAVDKSRERIARHGSSPSHRLAPRGL